jgi:hypothetical protein
VARPGLASAGCPACAGACLLPSRSPSWSALTGPHGGSLCQVRGRASELDARLLASACPCRQRRHNCKSWAKQDASGAAALLRRGIRVTAWRLLPVRAGKE